MLVVSRVAEGAVSLIAVMGFVLGFSIGSGPIPWVYLPEVLPNEIKGPAAALCTSLNWLSNLIVGLTFPAMLALLHLGGAYLVYAVSALDSLCSAAKTCARVFCRCCKDAASTTWCFRSDWS